MAGIAYTYDTGTDKNVEPEGVAEFFACVEEGKHQGVAVTLAMYPNAIHWKRHMPDVEGHDEDALHVAAQNGKAEIVGILLRAHAPVDTLCWADTKSTPLQAAVNAHHCKTVEALLKGGANPNLCDGDGYAPLVYAVCAMRTDLAELLLQHGASPDARGGSDVPMLAFAGSNGDRDMIDLLLRHGARIDTTDKDGRDVPTIVNGTMNHQLADVIVKGFWENNKRLKDAFDQSIRDIVDDMGKGTQAPLPVHRPLKLKAGA
ncbi:MAG: ankyrin repeat domain-containing protein [Alphaproteobacteria bacterium]